MLTELESRWLRDWACPIVGVSDEHRQDCEDREGASGELRLNPKLRFPGYIGENFESSRIRILCVAQIDHATQLFGTLGHLQDAMASWSRGVDSTRDEEFFRLLQTSYQAAITGWGPWTKIFSHILRAKSIDEKSIAFTNFAKCSQKPRHPKMYTVMRCCERKFPIASLARLLRPDAILEITSDPGFYVGVRSWGIEERNIIKLKGIGQDISKAMRKFEEVYDLLS